MEFWSFAGVEHGRGAVAARCRPLLVESGAHLPGMSLCLSPSQTKQWQAREGFFLLTAPLVHERLGGGRSEGRKQTCQSLSSQAR